MSADNQNEFVATLRRITELLEDLRLPYHLTGGLVSTYYGEPRFTQDIDIVVRLDEQQLPKFLARCEADYFFNAGAIREATRERRLAQLLDRQTSIKIDLHIGEAIPAELSRSVSVQLFEGVTARIASIEDAIASKLLWIKRGSSRSRNDILGMLRGSGSIDMQVLRRLADSIDALELLEEITASA